MSDAPANACLLRDRLMPLFDVMSLDLASCSSLEVNTALNEFELQHPKLSHRFETWPVEVRQRITVQLDKWMAARKTAVIRLVSFGLHQGVAVALLHYVDKKS